MSNWLRKNKSSIGGIALVAAFIALSEWWDSKGSSSFFDWLGRQGFSAPPDIVVDGFMFAVVALVLLGSGVFGWLGLRALTRYRDARSVDVSHLAPTPPPQVARCMDRLKSAGFSQVGVSQSPAPLGRRSVTAWHLVDPSRTTVVEVGAVPGPLKLMCAFSTVFADGLVLATMHPFGEERQAERLVMQVVPSSAEEAWQRHRDAVADESRQHGAGQRVHYMADVTARSAGIRAVLSQTQPKSQLVMWAGWLAAGIFGWTAILITGIVHLQSGVTTAAVDAWLDGLTWPIVIAMFVAGLPSLFNIRRMMKLAQTVEHARKAGA